VYFVELKNLDFQIRGRFVSRRNLTLHLIAERRFKLGEALSAQEFMPVPTVSLVWVNPSSLLSKRMSLQLCWVRRQG
jgi:hypothetical protein